MILPCSGKVPLSRGEKPLQSTEEVSGPTDGLAFLPQMVDKFTGFVIEVAEVLRCTNGIQREMIEEKKDHSAVAGSCCSFDSNSREVIRRRLLSDTYSRPGSNCPGSTRALPSSNGCHGR